MIDKPMFLHLQSTTMDPCSLTNADYAEARNTWLCTGCGVPKPGVHEVDVFLEEAPGDKPLNIVNGCGLPIAYKPFLDEFPSDTVRRDLYLGQVYGPGRRLLTDWVTFRGRRRLIIRGSKNVGHRKCSECGRDVYFATGARYLYPEPPSDAALFESDCFGLILAQDLVPHGELGKWSKLRIDRLPVLQSPKDALGELVYA
jgi:hypothetical protein